MIAVDTNVLVYAVDMDEPDRRTLSRSLLANLSDGSKRPVLLWQVAAEFLGIVRRWQAKKPTFDPLEAMTYLSVIRQAFHFVPPTESVLDRSLSLSARYSLSHWDSLLLAACAEAGVTTLYSEDLSDGQTYGPVAVVNPFR